MASTDSHSEFAFNSLAGRFVALCFVSSSRSPAGRAMIEALQVNRALFRDMPCSFLGATADPLDLARSRVKDDIPGIRWFHDKSAAVARQYGALDPTGRVAACWFMLDPTLRVIAAGSGEDLGALIALAARLPPPHLHAGCELTAPVLLMARVFEPALCRALMDYYAKKGGAASGFVVERDGKTLARSDPGIKRRWDCIIEDEELLRACRVRVQRRLAPEIAKAFQFHATRMERYIVACYRGEEAGYFSAHRDDTTKGTAHRKFAVTLNLNAEEYEGGELRFPEFGTRTYKPPTGGAVVFSCSLFHEALPVRSGMRYAFLPFLYDEAAAALREANNRHLDPSVGQYRPA
jgi:hypothetical protein